jgi:carboxyl-terminal processing protease
MNSRSKLVIVSMSVVMTVALLVGTVLGKAAAPGNDEKYKYLSVFTDVVSRIKTEYVSEPDMKSVTLGAMNGLLESLDPFGSYLNAEQYKIYLKNKEGRKADVGLVLCKKMGYVMVVDSIEGSPAAKAGLNTNAILESIQGVSTRDMPLAFAEYLLSGDPGSVVELQVLNNSTEPTNVKLTRQVVAKPAVESKMLADSIGYLKVATLEYGKVPQVSTALQGLKSKGAKKIVLDLRNNAVGEPIDGIGLANLFLSKGLISYVKGQKVEEKRYTAEAAKAIWNDSLIVLVNRGTAGGAEVAASALLENKRAEVVGEKTYGNAALRQAILLEDGSAVILATGKYYGPVSNKAIQDSGVTPSVVEIEYAKGPVAGDAEDAPAAKPSDAKPSDGKPADAKPGEDNVLKKALEVLEKGVAAVEKAAA